MSSKNIGEGNPTQPTSTGIFAINGDLDGGQPSEFQEREQHIGAIIGKEEVLLPISAVREIIMLTPITFVPNAPQCVEGVINLRGTIMAAINMRRLMGLPRGQASAATRIIIARFEGVNFGLIVDGITYVVSLLPSEIERQALPGKGTAAEYIGSVSKHGNKICGILDLARILKEVGWTLTAEPEGADDGATGEDASVA